MPLVHGPTYMHTLQYAGTSKRVGCASNVTKLLPQDSRYRVTWSVPIRYLRKCI